MTGVQIYGNKQTVCQIRACTHAHEPTNVCVRPDSHSRRHFWAPSTTAKGQKQSNPELNTKAECVRILSFKF